MSSFRKPKKLLRESAGAYVDGVWTAGARGIFTTLASCQPIVVGQDLKAVPEGRHISDFIKIYTSSPLLIAKDGQNIQSDIIVHEGEGFEVVSAFSNQSGVINHYKYIAVKVFTFTNNASWSNGTLKRA